MGWRYIITGILWLFIFLLLPLLLILTLPLYLLWFRPWQLRWGASNQEVERAMPGDPIVQRPTFNATRAVTVQGRPEDIWPWIIQIGCRRAGWYSYDWIDNLGFPSSQRILPEFQKLEEGDLIPFSPDGKMGMRVKEMKSNRFMLWTDAKGEATWCWGLYPTGETCTRLITRLRVHYNWKSPMILYYIIQDVGDILMMRKCLLGIKRRAQSQT